MSNHGSSETSSFFDETWSSWFCNLAGNHFFCEIDKAYIEDSFNLFGLKQYLPKDFSKALDTILDRLNEAETEELSRSAALLYGLIHARYIITSHGLEAMHRKYMQKGFGECPRMLCRGQPVLPMGFTDDPKHGMVKLFCPKCQDVYSCSPGQRHIDGAFFGPTFPSLFFMTYEDLVPEPVAEQYVPRVFGFRIHHTSSSLPRAGSGGRGGLGLYGFAGRGSMGISNGGGSQFGLGHTHSFLTQNNLNNQQNNGNHTSTSISESQSGARTMPRIVSGKRRHHGYHTSASDGHQSTTPVATGAIGTAVSLSGVLILPDNDSMGNPHSLAIASMVQGSSSSAAGTTSALTYTGLDGKIGIDIIENMGDGWHQGHQGGGSSGFAAPNLSGLGLSIHSHGGGMGGGLGGGLGGGMGLGGERPLATGVSTRERERQRCEREQEQRATTAPHQRSVPITTVAGPGRNFDRPDDDNDDDVAQRLSAKRPRHSSSLCDEQLK